MVSTWQSIRIIHAPLLPRVVTTLGRGRIWLSLGQDNDVLGGGGVIAVIQTNPIKILLQGGENIGEEINKLQESAWERLRLFCIFLSPHGFPVVTSHGGRHLRGDKSGHARSTARDPLRASLETPVEQ